jgi:hypothetical protein
MSYSLRRMFAIIMVFYESMSKDYRRTMSNNLKYVQQMVLKDIDGIISSMDKGIRDYGLPELGDQDLE